MEQLCPLYSFSRELSNPKLFMFMKIKQEQNFKMSAAFFFFLFARHSSL